ncbi:MAG: CYTH domain-containing protein [Paludibacteraceae bacterium]
MEKNTNIEIERKFLVKGDFDPFVSEKYIIRQGYILTAPDKTVRIRIKGDKGFITIKGKANENGFSRFEWEKEISVSDAEQLLELCEDHIIDKTRNIVIFEEKTFEVDVFQGVNEGLVMAELELQAENEPYNSPDWLGLEVTGDKRYYNSYLSKKPFKEW